MSEKEGYRQRSHRILNIFFCVYLSLAVFVSSQAFAQTVVVVGAGLSGLTTAYELSETFQQDAKLKSQNHHVEVYEAKDRPGGRVLTVMLNGLPVELGGENLNDGGAAENIRSLIKKMKLQVKSTAMANTDHYFFDPVSKKTYFVEKDLIPSFPLLSEAEISQTLEEAEEKSTDLQQVIDLFFKKYAPKNPESLEKFEILKRLLIARIKSYEGGQPSQLSARYARGSFLMIIQGIQKIRVSQESGIIPNDYKYISDSIAGGNSQLVLALVNRLGKHLYLQRPLKKLSLSNKKQIELIFGGGKNQPPLTVFADLVVLSLPAKVYKSVEFGEGTLALSQIQKISSIEYGTHAKILVPHVKNTKKISASTDGLSGWFISNGQFLNLYFNGSAGIMKSPEEFSKGLELGAKIFEPTGVRVPISPISVPQEAFSSFNGPVGMSWATDPFIQASYSYYSSKLRSELETKVTYQGEEVLSMFTPISDQIFFAGEHTTVHQDIRGTLEAAVESGMKASRLIIRQLKENRPN